MELNTCTRGEDVGNNDFFSMPDPPVWHIDFWETVHLPLPLEVSVNAGLGKGYLGSFPEMYNEPSCLSHFLCPPHACLCWPEKFRSVLE